MCKPDWDFWKHKTTVEKWQAAFLSCDIDPYTQSYRDINHYGLDNEKVSKRLQLLKDNSHLRIFFSPSIINIGDSNLSHVKLAEFSAWCLDRNYDILKELAALAKKPDTAIASSEKNAKESTIKAPMRFDKKRAFLLDYLNKEKPPNFASVWQYIQDNAGKENFLFRSASRSTATMTDEEMVEKKNLSRQFGKLLKKIKERKNL